MGIFWNGDDTASFLHVKWNVLKKGYSDFVCKLICSIFRTNPIVCTVPKYQKQYFFRLNSLFSSINGCGDAAILPWFK